MCCIGERFEDPDSLTSKQQITDQKDLAMRSRLVRVCVFIAGTSVLLIPGLFAPGIYAQKAPLWYSVVEVKRVEKPNRQRTQPVSKTGRQKAALLTLQWHLVKRVDDKNREEADPRQEFQTGDQLKVALTVNQSGYLYIVNQPQGKDGVLLFPDLRINKGQNYVLKNQEYVIPTYCPAYEDPKDCWYEMTPPAGTETLIVIFSRDKITTLPNAIDKPNSVVKRSVVDQLISTSEKKVNQVSGELTIPGKKAVRYATRVQNPNLQDNEELIATIEVRHSE
jgi:Domain of unknown function (DUF4384)